uniref:IS200/IS605 family transposase n=2 Tax=Oribacterium sp. NK2B42 TaxID=689781 RepID=UPI00049297E6
MDNQSLSHSKYNCTYHIVFIPKYRRKVMYGKLQAEVGQILGKVCKMEGVTIIKAATMTDHVHMYVSI